MKRMNPIAHNDLELFEEICEELLHSQRNQPALKQSIADQYAKYEANFGNPFQIDSVKIPNRVIERLHNKYTNATDRNKFSYIWKTRRRLSPDVCPLCGSMSTSTADHFLPKEDYPEFYILSKNLVPACKCNSHKNLSYRGTLPSERILHPYYDDVLKERLLALSIIPVNGTYDIPNMQLNLAIPNTHLDYSKVKYHFDKVIKNVHHSEFFEKEWEKMLGNPKGFFSQDWQVGGGKSKADLKMLIHKFRISHDQNFATFNNWHSIFFLALENDVAVTDYLYDRIK